MQFVRTEMVDGGQEVERGNLFGGIDAAVQLDGAVDIFQGHFPGKSSVFVFPVERDILVSVLAIIYGRHQSLHDDVGILLLPVGAVHVQVQGDFPQFCIVQHGAQVEVLCLHLPRIGEVSFFFVGRNLYVRINLSQICPDASIGNEVSEIAG